MATTKRTRPAPSPVLTAATEATRAETLAAARKFALAAEWAAAHPAPVVDDVVDELGDLVMFGDQPVTLAGEGAPGMSEFAIGEFAAACGMSTYQGRAFIGAALECRYRLPQLWERVMAGQVAVWKVRRVTEQTHRLTPPAAAYVDAQLAPILATCSYAQIERAVTAAAAEVDDEHFEEQRAERYAAQYCEVGLAEAALNNGMVPVRALLDYADAVLLEKRLQADAKTLRETYPDLPLEQRRAMALARPTPTPTHSGDDDTGSAGGGEPVREVVLYAHYTPDQVDGHGHDIVDVEKLGATTLDQIAAWCHHYATKITVKPVLDLTAEITIPGYRPSAVLREQVILTCPTCVFPGCARPARSCDLDHIVPYRHGGQTTTGNLAPLCRLHHRMKTFGYWTYHRTGPTSFEWTSPHGRVYDVDLTHKRRRTR